MISLAVIADEFSAVDSKVKAALTKAYNRCTYQHPMRFL